VIARFSIGWDVGGWNCDRNRLSRDAIVILDQHRKILGTPWRGNLSTHIHKSKNTGDFLSALFSLCKSDAYQVSAHVTLAIDAPLGFPIGLIGLLLDGTALDPGTISSANPYLFRMTERHLAKAGLTPLSAVKDMIGSQASKAIHAVKRFAPKLQSTGVWTDGGQLVVVETYPAACRKLYPPIDEIILFSDSQHVDIRDASICAVVAHWYCFRDIALEPPPSHCPEVEGWIWLPNNKAGE
jgi:predicted nuclease with RNAse H fold